MTTLRKCADRATEIFMALPKGGKTLGGSDAAFLQKAGFTAVEKLPRVDDYRLVDGPAFEQIGVRVFESKPIDALHNMADGYIDVAIVGLDVLKEFNRAVKGQKGKMQGVEIVNLDVAPCALVVCVREDSGITNAQQITGLKAATKYPKALTNWAGANNVTQGDVVVRSGGIEGYHILDPEIKIICDMVESGASLVANGWKPLGIDDALWGDIKAERKKFSDLTMEEMQAISGVAVASRAALVRTPRRLSAEKEAAIATLIDRFKDASQQLGNKPVVKQKGVANQTGRPRRRRTVGGSVSGYGVHSKW